MARSVIIIGAGISGLSAGCYGRMNGYDTHIFEMHDKPGGLCTSWKRKGYTFDGCVHWLIGTGEKSPFRKIWQELGALNGRNGRTVVDHEDFTSYRGENGQILTFYTNVDRLEKHMKEFAPEDASLIEEFTNAIRRCSVLDMPVDNLGVIEGLTMGAKLSPVLGLFGRLSKTSVRDFACGFSNEFLREAFIESFPLPHFPMIGVVFPLSLMSKGDAGYPMGGSLEFAKTIERRYRDLGGQVTYNSRVERVLVENDRAYGVKLADGTEHRADYVISAADGRSTIFGMLEGKYADDRIRGYYNGVLEPYPPLIQVSMGVARDFSDEPHSMNYRLSQPIIIGGKEQYVMGYRHYCYDPTMAPSGKSVLITSFFGDYDYWRSLSEDQARYEAEKEDIARQVVSELDKKFPGFQSQVEAIDVATPMTYERYTGNWRASFEGWLISTETAGMMRKGLPKRLPGLGNFHMIGQWTTTSAGLPPSAKDGRDVIKKLCKQDGKRFVTV